MNNNAFIINRLDLCQAYISTNESHSQYSFSCTQRHKCFNVSRYLFICFFLLRFHMLHCLRLARVIIYNSIIKHTHNWAFNELNACEVSECTHHCALVIWFEYQLSSKRARSFSLSLSLVKQYLIWEPRLGSKYHIPIFMSIWPKQMNEIHDLN